MGGLVLLDVYMASINEALASGALVGGKNGGIALLSSTIKRDHDKVKICCFECGRECVEYDVSEFDVIIKETPFELPMVACASHDRD
ncbi:MAG: hypothetical protein ABSE80_08755 [Halobacteriota archaeon]|jgi:hypothetical protein